MNSKQFEKFADESIDLKEQAGLFGGDSNATISHEPTGQNGCDTNMCTDNSATGEVFCACHDLDDPAAPGGGGSGGSDDPGEPGDPSATT